MFVDVHRLRRVVYAPFLSRPPAPIPALGFIRIVPDLLRKKYYEIYHTYRAVSKMFDIV